MPELKVREILDVDLAYDRFIIELSLGDRADELPSEREVFKAGWAAAIEALIDGKQVKTSHVIVWQSQIVNA
jgi:hypothetical protein